VLTIFTGIVECMCVLALPPNTIALRWLMNHGIPEDIHWMIEAKV